MSKHVHPFVEALKQAIQHEVWKVADYRNDADHMDIFITRQFGPDQVSVTAYRVLHLTGVCLLLNHQSLWLHPQETNSLYKALWKVHNKVRKRRWREYCARQKLLAEQAEKVLMPVKAVKGTTAAG